MSFWKKRIWHILDAEKLDNIPTRLVRWLIVLLIMLNAIAIVLGSYPGLKVKYDKQFYWFEVLSVIVFSIEYLARLLFCTVDKKYKGTVLGRLKWMTRFMSIVDLVAILPFFLPMLPIDLRFLRVLRVLRVLRIAKLGRFSRSLTMTFQVIARKKEQLFASILVMCFCVFMASCIMFHFENKAQPEAFSSIPATMWWAVVTLTTIGYGDIYPITVGGKVISCIFALIGIGIVALPTGILSSGFIEVFEKQKKQKKKNFCSNCGEGIE